MEEAPSVRERVLEGCLVCVGRFGLARTTVDDVARASGVSRATVYRYFPGGRDELVRDLIAWEMGRFFCRLEEAVAGAAGFATLVEEALGFAHRAVAAHGVLQRVLDTEPDRLLPLLTVNADRLLPAIAGFLVPFMERERDAGRLRPAVDVDRGADFVARMLLSFISTPGCWDLSDPAAVQALVRGQVLAGMLEPDAGGP